MYVIVVVCIIFNVSKIAPSLKEILKNTKPDEKIAVLVHLKEKPDYELIKNLSAEDYVEFLKNFSENSQRNILNYLYENFINQIKEIKPYWIFNGFYLKATKEVIENLAKSEEINYIIEDFVVKIEKPEISFEIRTPEWNISRIKADSCWIYGYTGEGIIIGEMDTGVDTSHPALQGKFEGHWYDAVNGQPVPYDDHGHGTHVMGIILGGDGLGPFTEDIGVAPDAQFTVCKVFNQSGSAQVSWLHAGFQKIAEWKGQGVDIKAVNNSWGSSNTTSLEFWDDCMNLKNLRIIPVFSIGSSGPSPGTTATPGNFPIVTGAGATDANDNIANFSSRGPAPNQPPWNDPQYWTRPDWNLTKPDISAPGVSIRSSVPGGGYQTWSGTSMSTSHLTGAIAILYQKNPNLDFYQVYQILTDYAYHPPQGQPYPNNNYGWGRLDLSWVYQVAVEENNQNKDTGNNGWYKWKVYDVTGRTIGNYSDLKNRMHKKGIYFIIKPLNKKIKTLILK